MTTMRSLDAIERFPARVSGPSFGTWIPTHSRWSRPNAAETCSILDDIRRTKFQNIVSSILKLEAVRAMMAFLMFFMHLPCNLGLGHYWRTRLIDDRVSASAEQHPGARLGAKCEYDIMGSYFLGMPQAASLSWLFFCSQHDCLRSNISSRGGRTTNSITVLRR